jgi:hypothetical protein
MVGVGEFEQFNWCAVFGYERDAHPVGCASATAYAFFPLTNAYEY